MSVHGPRSITGGIAHGHPMARKRKPSKSRERPLGLWSRFEWEDAHRRQDDRVLRKLFARVQAGDNAVTPREFAALLDFVFPMEFGQSEPKGRRAAKRAGVVEWTDGKRFVRAEIAEQ